MRLNSFAVILGVVVLFGFASCSKPGAEGAAFSRDEAGAPMASRSFAKAAAAELAPAELAMAPVPATQADSADQGATQGGPVVAGSERKLVRTANLQLRVADLGASEAAAQKLTADLGGYVASSNRSGESVSMSLRIPRASFDAALGGIAPLGKELWRNVNTEDVTLHWYDLEGRLQTKRELMATLRGYLKRSQSIEDLMTVETKLADLQNEIDSLGGQFKHLSDLVDFATINVEFVLPAASVQTVEPTLGERIGDVLRGTGGFFSALIAGLVGLLVFGVPILALAALLFWLLFGKVGLLLKLYRLVAGPKEGGKKGANRPESEVR